ncbi:MAG TPA: hypothetical protein VFD66_06160 [Verrucomicrobiae bacterium]|nr:hypothetical protein [Verrucomicrobiae bacterium]
MKLPGLLLILFLAAASRLPAQVTVEVALDQDEFLPGEPLPASVRITNRSGQTLHLGKEDDWLALSVESKDGYVVLRNGDIPVVGEFTLDSSMRAIKRVDVAPHFNLIKPGRYSMQATVTIKEWDRQVTSKPKFFDIIQGATKWEQEIGVPRAAGASNSVPEIRKYTLQEANYLRHHLMLYFQLTDNSGKLNKVFPIGPMLSFGQPEPQVDKWSNLHVLYQNGPHSFNYTIIDPNGNVIGRQTYDFTTRPRLHPERDGSLTISGGHRRLTSDDLPPSDVTETNAATAKP